ncbi:sigma 54-interacting transcriptional regulator, partial [Acidobacteriota bacterium]
MSFDDDSAPEVKEIKPHQNSQIEGGVASTEIPPDLFSKTQRADLEIVLDALLFVGQAQRAALLLCSSDGQITPAILRGFALSDDLSSILGAAGAMMSREQKEISLRLEGEPPRPAAFIPLLSGKRLLALVHLDRRPEDREFTSGEIENYKPHLESLSRSLEKRRHEDQSRSDRTPAFLPEHLFKAELGREIRRASRYLKSCSLLVLDHTPPEFASPEDAVKPAQEIILAVGSRYISLIRDIDLICWSGGLRFDILLPDTDKEGSRSVAGRILRIADEKKIEWKEVLTPAPVNIGIATYPEDALEADSLHLRAMSALDESRQLGPNMLHLFGMKNAPRDKPRKPLSRQAAKDFFRVNRESMTAIEMADRLLKTGLGFDQIPDTVIALGSMGVNAQRGCLALYDSEKNLNVKAYFHSDKIDDEVRFSPPEQMLQRAIHTGKPVTEGGRVNGSPGGGGPSTCAPVAFEGETVGVLYFENLDGGRAFDREDANFLEIFSKKISEPVHRLYKREREEATLKAMRSTSVTHYKYSYDNIIGVSKVMQQLYELLDKVVETDHSVIIQGESGTGKELVAHAIHFNGRRKEKPFIAENCAALSDNLLEAELFGYVRGAFTGADQDRKGFFEIATGGTLFLDEIGEMNIKM